jgi:nicotinamide-nucleotide amidase
MYIEVVSIGDELLKGIIVNTNVTFISRTLFEHGYAACRHTVFSDDPRVLDKELRAALSRSSVIITTGGLGCTLDDHTRQIASALFTSELQYNELVGEDIKKRFGTTLDLKEQATIPVKAMPLLNTVGMAPGLVFTAQNKMLILLPGVPLEMQVMFTDQVLPLLQERFPLLRKKEYVKLNLCLLNESEADPFLRELKKRFADVDIGIYPSFGTLSLLLSSENKDQLARAKQECQTQFHSYLFTSENSKIEEAVQHWFIQHRKTLALAESCTGGTIASQIVSVPGASAYFLGSFVVYSDAFKTTLLGVSKKTLETYGAVSKECVQEMLEGVFQNSAADYAIAVSGIAGPTGGSSQKPVGTVWAAIGERGKPADIGHFAITGPRSKIIQKSSSSLLGALFRKIAYGIAPLK